LTDTDDSKRIAYKLAVVDDDLKAIINNLLAMGQFAQVSAHFGHVTHDVVCAAKDLLVWNRLHKLKAESPNPLNKFGQKCFSQNDEDGITMEIVRRLGIERGKGRFAEFGVGNGLENNTIILGALGYSGFWVGGEDLAIEVPKLKRLHYIKDWITLENIIRHARTGLGLLGADSLDVISLDLDGNDIYFVENLLENGFTPKLFIVEYNGKFPPPGRFQIAYNPDHTWTGDDFYGAALANFNDLFEKYQYRLVCCSLISGANAFFVRDDFSHLFEDVPRDIRDLYSQPFYRHFHPITAKVNPKTVEALFM